MWQNLSLSEARRSVEIRNMELPLGISARNLVLELNSHVCGGQRGQPITTDWTFMDQCVYQCTCTEGLFHFTSCNCQSSNCESQLVRFLDEVQDGLVHNFTDTNTCPICHNNTGRLLPGQMTLVKRGIPNAADDGVGLELNGAYICNSKAPETNLVMPPVAAREIRVTVRNPADNEVAIAEATYETDYAELASTIQDWTDVDAAIRQSSGGTEGACGLIAMTDDSELAPDVTPPSISPPANISMACEEYRAAISSGQRVADLLGTPTVQDDRDGAPAISNNAPASLQAGNTVIVWTATDASGNAATTQQSISITDSLAPVFQGPLASVTVSSSGQGGTTAVALVAPVANDACDGAIQATTQTDLSAFAIGSTDVLWRAQDSSGNIAEALQTVEVLDIPGDLNGDGVVDQADLNRVLDALSQPSLARTELADFNGNGVIDEDDQAVLALIQQGGSDPRDVDGDGDITGADATMLQGLCSTPCVILPHPTDLYGRAKPDKTNLVWTPVDGHSYRVLRATQSSGPYEQVGTVVGGLFVDNAVSTGNTYFYVVQGENSASRSIFSNEVSLTIPSATRRR
jgi:hypothetical protein